MRIRPFPMILIGAFLALLLVFRATRDDSLDRLRSKGTITIGYAVEAPYAFLTPDGTVTGEAPEIAKVMASRLGIGHIAWRQVEFGSLLAELEAGRIDVIAAGMFITPKRADRASFSLPTFRVREGLLVPRGIRAGSPPTARRPSSPT